MLRTIKNWLTGLLLATCALSVAQAQSEQPTAPEHFYTQQELDQMLAPIALYPDPLLTQILMASTYPLEVVKAARWSRAHPELQGDDAVRAAVDEDWDPSVKSLVAFPRVLAMMDERIDWTEQLGEAFLAQEPHVMDTIQSLRERAYAAGNLSSNADTLVAREGSQLVIQPANPVVMYVPYYDPWVVYGTWWWPAYPPVYWAPWPGYVRPGVSVGIYWGSGIALSTGFFFGAFDWHRHHVDVVYVNNYYYRPRVSHSAPLQWRHEPEHRRGVPYRHEELRTRYPQPVTRAAPRPATPHTVPPRTEPRRFEPQPRRAQPGYVEPRRDAPPQQRAPQQSPTPQQGQTPQQRTTPQQRPAPGSEQRAPQQRPTPQQGQVPQQRVTPQQRPVPGSEQRPPQQRPAPQEGQPQQQRVTPPQRPAPSSVQRPPQQRPAPQQGQTPQQRVTPQQRPAPQGTRQQPPVRAERQQPAAGQQRQAPQREAPQREGERRGGGAQDAGRGDRGDR